MRLSCVLDDAAARKSSILKFCDSKHLPWRDSVHDLVARFGIAPEPWYGWDTIPIDTPLLDGLKVPLRSNVYPYLSAAVPLIYYSGGVYVSGDEHENFAYAVAQLEHILGPGSENSVSNAIGKRWEDGYAIVDATIFPRSLQRPNHNPSHERHPFLAVTCGVSICMHYLLPMSTSERASIQSFRSLLTVSEKVELIQQHWRDAQYTREFMRAPAPAVGRALGISGDGGAILTIQGGIANIYPLARIKGITLETVPDDRDGPAMHRLTFTVPRDFGAPGGLRELELATQLGGEPFELQAIAATLSDRL